MKIIRVFWFLIFLGAVTLALTKSTVVIVTPEDKAHLYTRTIEFDYLGWTLNAVGVKTGEAGIGVTEKLTLFQKHQVVVRYFDLVRQLEDVTGKVQAIYSDPSIKDPQLTAKDDLTQQEALQAALGRLDPIVEDILQQQVAEIVIKLGIARIGEVLPPVLYHTSATPKSLITSPRNKIEQDVSISLMADLTLAETNKLEAQVEEKTGESALVVGTGGIGVYPTMVMRTSDLSWVVNTIAHE